MTKPTKTAILAALKGASLPKPTAVEITIVTIEISFTGEHEGLAGAVSRVLQEKGINYADPRPDTPDVSVQITQTGVTAPIYRVILVRHDKEFYDAALDELAAAQNSDLDPATA